MCACVLVCTLPQVCSGPIAPTGIQLATSSLHCSISPLQLTQQQQQQQDRVAAGIAGATRRTSKRRRGDQDADRGVGDEAGPSGADGAGATAGAAASASRAAIGTEEADNDAQDMDAEGIEGGGLGGTFTIAQVLQSYSPGVTANAADDPLHQQHQQQQQQQQLQALLPHPSLQGYGVRGCVLHASDGGLCCVLHASDGAWLCAACK